MCQLLGIPLPPYIIQVATFTQFYTIRPSPLPPVPFPLGVYCICDILSLITHQNHEHGADPSGLIHQVYGDMSRYGITHVQVWDQLTADGRVYTLYLCTSVGIRCTWFIISHLVQQVTDVTVRLTLYPMSTAKCSNDLLSMINECSELLAMQCFHLHNSKQSR